MARQPKNFIKISLVLLFLFWFFSPTIIFALDQRCWEKDKCIAPEIGGSFYGPNDETITACGGEKNAGGKELGFCKPPYVANTEIDFGGRTSFENIGVFIKYMFRYSVMAAGILSVIMIMFAGFEWVTSGGNSEKISGAKKKISGAIMGLLIASLSYALLSTINPYLVNLRLPQAWMINTQGLAPTYCNTFDDNQKVAHYAFQGTEGSETDKLKKEAGINYDVAGIEPSKTVCGNKYFVAATGGQTCWGLKCTNPKGVCVDFLSQDPKKPYNCGPWMMGGKITRSALLDVSESIVDTVTLYAVCGNGDIEGIGTEDTIPLVKGSSEYYKFPQVSNLKAECGEKGGLVGFYLGIQVNDETGFGGKLVEGGAFSWGQDDYFAVGQVGKNSHSCTVNLSKVAYRLTNNKEPECKYNICTCAYVSYDPFLKQLAKNSEYTKHLISLEELEDGYNCNIVINRSEFPAADNDRNNYSSHSFEEYLMSVGLLSVYDVGVGLIAKIYNLSDDPTSCQEYQSIS